MKYFLIAALSLLNFATYSQVLVVDIHDGLPVPGANIYRDNGSLIGFTDRNGQVEWINSTMLSFPLQALVQHTSFQSAEFTMDDQQTSLRVEVEPLEISLNRVEINQTIMGDVIVLKGYYRSLETFGYQHKTFSDGIITYYIPKNGNRIRYHIADHRLFADSAVMLDYDSKMGPFFQIPRIPLVSGVSWSKRFEKYKVDFSEDRQVSILRDKEAVGTATLSRDSLLISLYLDHVLPDSVKSEKLFRLEGKTKKDVSMESYRYRVFDKIGPFDLESIYQNVVGTIKRKPEYGHIPYEVLNEFYVFERDVISMEEYKSRLKGLEKNIYKAPSVSSFSTEYWKSPEISSIPASDLPLGNTLQLIISTN